MKTMTRPAALPVAPSSRQAALIAASLSANSRRAYRYAWESWLDWLGDEPASDATLSAYFAALHDAGKAPATCALHAAALRFAHRVGIRRKGRTRGCGQVKGIMWAQAGPLRAA